MKRQILYYLPLFLLVSLLFLNGCKSTIHIPDVKTISSSYSMFGQEPSRKFYIPTTLGDSLKLRWKEDINGSFGATSVTAIDKYVFVPDLSGRVFAFNLETGKQLGYKKYKGAVFPAPVIQNNIIIYSVSEINKTKSTLYFYDFQNGKETKSVEIEGNIKTELIKLEDGIVLVSESGTVYKYSYKGEVLWEYDSKSFVESSPVVSGTSIILGNVKGEVISLSGKSGALNYRKKTSKSGFEGGFAALGSKVFTGDNDGFLYCIDAATGNVTWKYNSGNKITVIPVTDGKFLYAGNLKGDVFKLDQNSGELAWRISTGGVINVTPLLFNDVLVQPDMNRKLFLIDVNSGKKVKTMEFETRVRLSPVYFGQSLIIGIDNGMVMAYDQVKR